MNDATWSIRPIALVTHDAQRTRTLRRAVGQTSMNAAVEDVRSLAAACRAVHSGSLGALFVDAASADAPEREALLALCEELGGHAPVVLLYPHEDAARTGRMRGRGAADCLAWSALDAAALERSLTRVWAPISAS